MNHRLSVEDATRTLEKVLPVRQGDLSLQLATGSSVTERDGSLIATLRLFVFEAGAIRDIKEQDVLLLHARHREVGPDRFEAFITGWARALRAFFEERGVATVEQLMPCDLLFAEVAGMKRPQTAEEFARACGTETRLGQW